MYNKVILQNRPLILTPHCHDPTSAITPPWEGQTPPWEQKAYTMRIVHPDRYHLLKSTDWHHVLKTPTSTEF